MYCYNKNTNIFAVPFITALVTYFMWSKNKNIQTDQFDTNLRNDVPNLVTLQDHNLGCTLPNKDNPFMNTPFFDVAADKELPKSLNESIFIPKGKYHRLIKGDGDLRIKVKKFINESVEKKLEIILNDTFYSIKDVCSSDEEYFDFCEEIDAVEKLEVIKIKNSERYKNYDDVYVNIRLNKINYHDFEYDLFYEIRKRFPIVGFNLILNDIRRPNLEGEF